MGLSALTELAASIEERYNIECYFSSHGDIDLTNNFAATHLFRIAPEAVNNAIKHGGASQIEISMIGKERSILLEVLDFPLYCRQCPLPSLSISHCWTCFRYVDL